MKKFLYGIVGALVVSASLASCATVKEHESSIKLIVQVVAIEYIKNTAPDAKLQKASRVVYVLQKIREVADAGPVSIADLAAVALAQIPNGLEPEEKLLAVNLIDVLQKELGARIGDGAINANQLATVKEVLEWIEDAIRLSVPATRTIPAASLVHTFRSRVLA